MTDPYQLLKYLINGLIIFVLLQIIPNYKINVRDAFLIATIIVLSYYLIENIGIMCKNAIMKDFINNPRNKFIKSCNTNYCKKESFSESAPIVDPNAAVTQANPQTNPQTISQPSSTQVDTQISSQSSVSSQSSTQASQVDSQANSQSSTQASSQSSTQASSQSSTQASSQSSTQASSQVNVPNSSQNTYISSGVQFDKPGYICEPQKTCSLTRVCKSEEVCTAPNNCKTEKVCKEDETNCQYQTICRKKEDILKQEELARKQEEEKKILERDMSAGCVYNKNGIERKGCRWNEDVMLNEMEYSDYSHVPLAEGYTSRDYEYGYSFMPPEKWYPQPPHPPVCVTEKRCPIMPMLTSGAPVDMKEWNASRRITPPDNIKTEYITDKLNSGK
jgi:hypothetical protein